MDVDAKGADSVSRENIIDWLQPFPEGVRKMLFAVMDRPDFALRIVEMANHMRREAKGKQQKWEDLAILGRRLAPHDPEICFHSNWALRRKVPRWHFPMLHDEVRNQAFQDGLEHFVDPSAIVFEIGTGSGILAMMAARAGARHVYTCEKESLIADAARENIRKNGYEDRITVIAKKSTDLTVGTDLPEKADMFIAEIVDNQLLGENVLPLMEDAKSRLLKLNAIILPGRIATRGVLVGDGAWTRNCRVGKISGFDLSAMNCLAPSETSVSANRDLADAFCDPVEIFAFDLAHKDAFPAEEKVIKVKIIRDGWIDGFVQWLWLGFGQTIVFENRPPQKSGWHPMLHLFPSPVKVRRGQQFFMTVAHNREHIYVAPYTGTYPGSLSSL